MGPGGGEGDRLERCGTGLGGNRLSHNAERTGLCRVRRGVASRRRAPVDRLRHPEGGQSSLWYAARKYWLPWIRSRVAIR